MDKRGIGYPNDNVHNFIWKRFMGHRMLIRKVIFNVSLNLFGYLNLRWLVLVSIVQCDYKKGRKMKICLQGASK